MLIVWTLIGIVTLVSALIVQQELRIGWGFWNKYRGPIFFNNLSSYSPQRNDEQGYIFYPQWGWKVGDLTIDLVYNPQGHVKDAIGPDYNPPVFKLGNFYIVIWS